MIKFYFGIGSVAKVPLWYHGKSQSSHYIVLLDVLIGKFIIKKREEMTSEKNLNKFKKCALPITYSITVVFTHITCNEAFRKWCITIGT